MGTNRPVANPRLAQRFAQAQQLRGISTRRLAESIASIVGSKARGASYAGVRGLVAGEILRPRTEIVRAAAQVLGVRPEWLMDGAGGMARPAEAPGVREGAEKGLRKGLLVSDSTEEDFADLPEPRRRVLRYEAATSRALAPYEDLRPGHTVMFDLVQQLGTWRRHLAPDPTPEAVRAWVDERFTAPLALSQTGASYGEKAAAFLTTAALQYLQLFGSSPSTPAETQPGPAE